MIHTTQQHRVCRKLWTLKRDYTVVPLVLYLYCTVACCGHAEAMIVWKKGGPNEVCGVPSLCAVSTGSSVLRDKQQPMMRFLCHQVMYTQKKHMANTCTSSNTGRGCHTGKRLIPSPAVVEELPQTVEVEGWCDTQGRGWFHPAVVEGLPQTVEV